MQAIERRRPIGYLKAKEVATDLLHDGTLPPTEQDLLYQELAASFLIRFTYEQLAINLGVNHRYTGLKVHTFYPDGSYAYLKSRFYSGDDGLNPSQRSGTEKFHLAWVDPLEGNLSLEVSTLQNPQACMVDLAIKNDIGVFSYSDTFERNPLT